MKNEGPEKHPVTRVAKRYGADAKSQLRGIEERMREFFGALSQRLCISIQR